MRYEPLPADFHAANRRRLSEAIGDESIAIIDTADVLRRPGDFEHPFRPDSNFYYLTGVDEPDAVLVLAPGHPNPHLREVLFLRETSDFIALWAGQRLTQAEGTARSGVATVLWLDELEPVLGRLVGQFRTIYLNDHPTLEAGPLSPSGRRAADLRTKLPLHDLRSATSILGRLRTIKAPAEIAQIRRAVDATAAGLDRAWSALATGVPEYALEAELTAEFTRRGATGSAFGAIIGAGRHSTTIHHATSATPVAAGDLVLFDVGAEAGYYAADITRTVPAGGRFTPRQRAVYEAVYRAQQAGIKLHRPGATILEIDETMRRSLTKSLVDLGEISAKAAAGPQADEHLRPYYAHISHHLGLDVHDTGTPRLKLEPGMVVTCEPGLYLAKEGIGVRLEDDILITKTGHEVLSRSIPSAPDDIEAAIARSRA
ncbi:MAG TPA: aminopeptidase P N-terminal domain-containing protein [Candidatus Saccharimonadia bacterium]|nr:aminopeptidase P N-terminal domain-containing protein [Candidatus Saccharimonadia bacterium]